MPVSPAASPVRSDLGEAGDGRSQPQAARPRAPSAPADRLGLFDALAPLLTDAFGHQHPGLGVTDLGIASEPLDAPDADPFQALVADIAVQQSRQETTDQGDRHRRALLRAVAELAETHAVAADLALETTAIDLPLDVPDPVLARRIDPVAPVGTRAAQPMLIVPDMIRTCRDRLAAHTGAADRTKLDIVATLFDHILADDRLATGVRNTLARLQLPVLRMALADESFFQTRTHPTRRLLDRLAGSAAEWDIESASGTRAAAELERIVHTVIRGSFEDAVQHTRLLEQFERAIVDIATTASATPVAVETEPEDRDVLVIKATIQISQLLAGVDVDRAVRFFLLDVWSRVLVEIALHPASHGRDALLARAKRLCFDLAWTAAPKTTSGERARLAGLLPTMIAAIRDGLQVIDYPEADEQRFFADWTRVLITAVCAAPGAGFRPSQSGIGTLTIDAFARRLRDGSFGAEASMDPPMDGSTGPSPRAIASNRGAPTTVGLVTPDDATPSMLQAASRRGPTTAGDPPTLAPIVIADLKKGQWFELRGAHGFVRVRLSWVSPLRSFYLFIGADSAITRSLDPDGMTALIARGDLRRASSRSNDSGE